MTFRLNLISSQIRSDEEWLYPLFTSIFKTDSEKFNWRRFRWLLGHEMIEDFSLGFIFEVTTGVERKG